MGLWSTGGDLLKARRQFAGCGTQNAGLSIGGRNALNNLSNTEEYDSSVWTTAGDLNVGRHALAGCGSQSGGLSFGGTPAVGANNITEEYLGTVWATGGNLNVGRPLHAGCGTISAGLAFGGGVTGSESISTEEYDASVWATAGDLIVGRLGLGGCGTQDAGLSFGGAISGVAQGGVEEYNASVWVTRTNMNVARKYVSGFGLQTAGVACGGAGNLTSAEEYFGGAWITVGDLNFGRAEHASGGTLNAGLTFGGTHSVSGTLPSTEEYISTSVIVPILEQFSILELPEVTSSKITPVEEEFNISELLSTIVYTSCHLREPTFKTVFGGIVDPSRQPQSKNTTVQGLEAYGFLTQLDSVSAYVLAQPQGSLPKVPGIKVIDCNAPTWNQEGVRKVQYLFKDTDKEDAPKFELRYLPNRAQLHSLHFFKNDTLLSFNYGESQAISTDTEYTLQGAEFDESLTVWIKAYPKTTLFTTFPLKKDPKHVHRSEVGNYGIPLLKLGDGPETILKPYFDRVANASGAYTDISYILNKVNAGTLEISPTGTTTLLIGDLDPFESFFVSCESNLSEDTEVRFSYSHGFGAEVSEGWNRLDTDASFVDLTNGFKHPGRIYFEAPQNWSTNRIELSSQKYDELFWLRIEFIFSDSETCTLKGLKRHVVCYDGAESLTVSVDYAALPSGEEGVDSEVIFRKTEEGVWEPATWPENISSYELLRRIRSYAQLETTILGTAEADPLALEMSEDYFNLMGQIPKSNYPFEPETLAVKGEDLLIGVGPELWHLEEKSLCVYGDVLDPKSVVGSSYDGLLRIRRLWPSGVEGTTGFWAGSAWWGPYWPNELRPDSNSKKLAVFLSDGFGVTKQEIRDYVFPGDMFYRNGRYVSPYRNIIGSWDTGGYYAGEEISIPFSQPIACVLDYQNVLYIAAGLTVASVKTDEWYFATGSQWGDVPESMKGEWYQCPPGFYMLQDNNIGLSVDYGPRRFAFTFGQEGFNVFDEGGEAQYYLQVAVLSTQCGVMKDTVTVQEETPIYTLDTDVQLCCGDCKNGVITAGLMDWWDGNVCSESYSHILRFPTYSNTKKLRDWDKAFSYTPSLEGWANVGSIGTSADALKVFEGNLYGGSSTPSGKVYRYVSGTSWTEVGQVGSEAVDVLTVFENNLYAGTYTDGKAFQYVTGASWTDLGQLGTATHVRDLAGFDGGLYGGVYSSGKVYKYVVGASWIDVGQLGSATNIRALANFNNTLYGGTDDSGKVYSYIAGTSWSSVGQLGSETDIHSLGVHQDELYGGTSPSGKVYRYVSGTSWTNIGRLGSNTAVTSLISHNASLYGAGYPEGEVYRHVEGTSWTRVGLIGTGDWIRTLEVYNNKLFASSISGEVFKYNLSWVDQTDAWNTNSSDFGLQEENAALYFGLTNRQFFSSFFTAPASTLSGTLIREFWNGSAWEEVESERMLQHSGTEYWRTWRIPRTWAKIALNTVAGTSLLSEDTSRFWMRERVSSYTSGGCDISGLYCYCEAAFSSQVFDSGKYLTFTPISLFDDVSNSRLYVSLLDRDTLRYAGLVVDYSADDTASEFTPPGYRAFKHFVKRGDDVYATLQDFHRRVPAELCQINLVGGSWTAAALETFPGGEFFSNALVGTTTALYGLTAPYTHYAFKYGKKNYPFVLNASFGDATLRKVLQQLAVLLAISVEVDPERQLIMAKRDYVPTSYKGITATHTCDFDISTQNFGFEGIEIEWTNPITEISGIERVGLFGASNAILSIQNPLIQDSYTAQKLSSWLFKFFSKPRKLVDFVGSFLFQLTNLDLLRVRLYPYFEGESDFQIRGFELDLKNMNFSANLEEDIAL